MCVSYFAVAAARWQNKQLEGKGVISGLWFQRPLRKGTGGTAAGARGCLTAMFNSAQEVQAEQEAGQAI